MLVVTRLKGQRIKIGPDIWLSVEDIEIDFETRQRKVRLGIEAPKDVLILREELVKERT